VRAKVLRVDRKRQRVGLSLRQADGAIEGGASSASTEDVADDAEEAGADDVAVDTATDDVAATSADNGDAQETAEE
jgi:ribosomal protein S1